ncbi:FAD-dependent oxidoreductase [Hydrogenophaga sp.]|uniref:FAD-dependent oxidoreductase n=1 Tax=Hydrogenophaga sp. TaxID=1904254 RepID=UPI002AB8A3A3|nr:FAD-dependent oxidoreductase [Hydrogenophaga sp.]MDZ4399795.1 FAD-dependent oxidoreductase [Hydrogenophaga sp.]
MAYTNGYEFTQGSGYTLPEYPFVTPPEIATGQVRRYPVVIVGGGITGLTMACALAYHGVKAVLLDEDNTVGVKGASSRGICYTQKSLEIFDRLGVYERIAAKGIQWSVGRTFAGKDEVYSFDLRQQSNFNLSTQPPFINIQQFYIEGYLAERIYELGHVDMRWSSRVTGFEENDDFATLTVETPAGPYRLQADHVIDATGSHTPFHAWCGATMQSRRGDDRWCIADVRFSRRPPVERHTWIEAPFNENRAVWQHLMADDVWRIDYQMAPNADPEYVSSEAQVRERLARQFGPDTEVEIVWVGPYAYRSQCLDRLRVGRVFFMGDTAKIVSPFGARGGNTGVADADNLAWKLAAVLQGRAAPKLLDSYHDERHEAAAQNVMVTNRTARFLRAPEGMERTFRNAAIGLAKKYPFARQLVNTGRMAVANTYTHSPICDGTGGQSVQNVSFEWADHRRGTVNDLLQWADANLLVLVFGDLSAAARQRLQQLSQTAPVRCVQVLGAEGHAQAREHVRDPKGHLQGACHVFGHAWALVRPDGYLAATGESVDADLVRAIEKSLGLN